MTEDPTTRSPRIGHSNSSKGYGIDTSVSEDLDDSDITDDDNEDYENNPTVSRSFSTNDSFENSDNFDNRRARSKSSHKETRQTETSSQDRKKQNNEKITNLRKDQSSLSKTCNSKSKASLSIDRRALFVAVFSVIAGVVCFSLVQSATLSPEVDRFKMFVKDIREIRDKFPRQNHRSWMDIQAGVSDVMNSSAKPWTFVLFSNETTGISCLAELLGRASSKALLSKNSLVLRPKDMGDEYGDAVDRLRPLILEKKAVVVHDLLNIDPGAIQAFHTMCDRENPLVGEAVYILTIIAPGYSSSQRPEVFVENLLTDRFANRVPEDKLQPLITRLTDGPIIPVVPGNSPKECLLINGKTQIVHTVNWGSLSVEGCERRIFGRK